MNSLSRRPSVTANGRDVVLRLSTTGLPDFNVTPSAMRSHSDTKNAILYLPLSQGKAKETRRWASLPIEKCVVRARSLGGRDALRARDGHTASTAVVFKREVTALTLASILYLVFLFVSE